MKENMKKELLYKIDDKVVASMKWDDTNQNDRSLTYNKEIIGASFNEEISLFHSIIDIINRRIKTK